MPTWQIILFSLIGALIMGIISGAIIGKSLKNKKNPNYKPVLSIKEKIILLVSITLGVTIILVGVFVPNKKDDVISDDFNGGMIEGSYQDGTQNGETAVINGGQFVIVG